MAEIYNKVIKFSINLIFPYCSYYFNVGGITSMFLHLSFLLSFSTFICFVAEFRLLYLLILFLLYAKKKSSSEPTDCQKELKFKDL